MTREIPLTEIVPDEAGTVIWKHSESCSDFPDDREYTTQKFERPEEYANAVATTYDTVTWWSMSEVGRATIGADGYSDSGAVLPRDPQNHEGL